MAHFAPQFASLSYEIGAFMVTQVLLIDSSTCSTLFSKDKFYFARYIIKKKWSNFLKEKSILFSAYLFDPCYATTAFWI